MTPQFQNLTRLRAQVVISLILIVTLALNTQAQGNDTKPQTVVLKRGQVLELLLLTPLDSGHAQVGDEVSLRLARPLTAEGVTALPAEWIVHGRITNVVRAGKNCKPGRIDWKLVSGATPDGKRIKIQVIRNYVAKPHGLVLDRVSLDTTGKKVGRAAGNIGKGIALAPVVVLLSPFLILMAIGMSGEGDCGRAAGSEKWVPAGTLFYAAVSTDVKVSVH